MNTRTHNVWIAVIVAVAVIIGAYLLYVFYARSNNESTVENIVTNFGTHLQDVSLLASDASSSIENEYGPFVTPQLLSAWESNPMSAPGRTTSSPWPDHLEVVDMTPQGEGYLVQAAEVFMTSTELTNGGNAGIIPVMLQVVPQNGTWLIAAYEEQGTTTPTTVE